MVGQVILVSIEAGIEVTDYALEWAVQNVIKPMDTLILLAIIPSPDYCLLPVKNTQPSNTSKGLFSRLLRKRSTAGKNDVSDKVGFVDEGRDIPQRVYDVCAQMIHHLFSLHKVVKVHTEVKVVAYAPVGSVAMVATEMHARWVILDHSYHKILRSVNFPFAVKTDQEQVPNMGNMLGALPAYTQANSTYGNGNHTSNKDDMKKETKRVPFPARQSVDLRRLSQQEKDYQIHLGQQTLRRVSGRSKLMEMIDETGTEGGEVMTWKNRMKVACGAARALRYLHEDCRVGCIVHRDFRPSNILLTHDFEPLVGDFGLARWQADGQQEEETRVVGAFGYLAPEYTQSGLITEKADVYAFGVVLLEILTGIKAIEFSRTSRQQYFPDWGRRLLVEGKVCAEIIDPKLGNKYDAKEVEYMMHAASLCISPHPEQRPRMSKVLRILEGNYLVEKLDYHQEQSVAIFLKPNLESYESSKDILLSKKQEKNHHQKPIAVAKLSSVALKLENSQDTILKPKTPLQKHSVSVEYQEYLQGSLHKHIQSFNKE
nr:inactive protein kinase SELMODRAFT_444075-like [Tanacetum cinerariifolium]